ncbi:hypothetical protein QUA51_09940 [Microcoleus sp. Pol10_D6]|uniref:hypothetical protein n=1 Tax=Microcoleus sp. Pol10_D6 TaxID=2818875 RepID=UPI002FD66323
MTSVPLAQTLLAKSSDPVLWIVEELAYIATFGIGISCIENGYFEFFFGGNCGDYELISPNI